MGDYSINGPIQAIKVSINLLIRLNKLVKVEGKCLTCQDWENLWFSRCSRISDSRHAWILHLEHTQNVKRFTSWAQSGTNIPDD